ncbi:hypothetical protein [Fusobacterium sp. PH5-44]|uniref:hypothetical protein n=1 Tax=unclassified Fusobacterium TaxID=2648384 RepID=UPI003D19F1A9
MIYQEIKEKCFIEELIFPLKYDKKIYANVIIYPTDGFYLSEKQFKSIFNVLTKNDKESKNEKKVGEKGTCTDSHTVEENGKYERIDVENSSPGKGNGNIHYHDADNTRWYCDLKTNQLVSKETGEVAPRYIQKIVKEEWFKKGITKALKVLGES